MRALLLVCLSLGLLVVCSSPALGVETCRTPAPKPDPAGIYDGGGRLGGGDTVAEALPILAVPFIDAGTTCGFANDYDAVCPFSGSTAPDVVYVYIPAGGGHIGVDLCDAQYDSKVYVWEDTPGNVIACSDDGGCGPEGYQSQIEEMYITPGHTYYFVVDGYEDECGEYSLAIMSVAECVLVCPPGAQQEGEPPCQDQYVDEYNSGCCCGTGFTPIVAGPDGTATMCAKACTFTYNGLSYRDSDWFLLTAGGPVTATCVAEFPVQFMLIYGTECGDLQFIWGQGGRCEPVTLNWPFEPGAVFYLWAGPSVFSGIPESDYRIEVSGLRLTAPSSVGSDEEQAPAAPGDRPTWSRVKSIFR